MMKHTRMWVRDSRSTSILAMPAVHVLCAIWISALSLYATTYSAVGAGTSKVADTNTDSPCVRYGFKAGDSLVFRVRGIDTLDFETRIARRREELYSYVCDHVTPSGQQFIRVTLQSARTTENTVGDTDSVTRTSSPWVGRTAYIILDSNGRRVLARQGDTVRSAVSPGGAFQPGVLFVGPDTTCHTVHQRRSWLITTTDSLAESAWPAPIIRSTYSCTLLDTTVGTTKCTAIRYAQTGQGSFKSITNDVGVVLHSIIDGYGKHILDNTHYLPLCGEMNSRIKVQVRMEKTSSKGTIRNRVSYERVFCSRP